MRLVFYPNNRMQKKNVLSYFWALIVTPINLVSPYNSRLIEVTMIYKNYNWEKQMLTSELK